MDWHLTNTGNNTLSLSVILTFVSPSPSHLLSSFPLCHGVIVTHSSSTSRRFSHSPRHNHTEAMSIVIAIHSASRVGTHSPLHLPQVTHSLQWARDSLINTTRHRNPVPLLCCDRDPMPPWFFVEFFKICVCVCVFNFRRIGGPIHLINP